MENEHDSTNGSPVKPPPKIDRKKMAAEIASKRLANKAAIEIETEPEPKQRDEFMRDDYAEAD